MENSSSIKQNLEALAKAMLGLKFCRSRVMKKEPKLLEARLESIDSAMKDFVELRGEWNKLKDHHSDDSRAHTKLNERVIESLKATTVLKKDVKAIMESMETLSDGVKADSPKLEFRNRTETSLTEANGANHKLEVATPLREVIETSGVKTEKPIIFTPADLRNFTKNFSNKIGADDIGEVFQGHFPGGEIAVTVLAGDNMMEETFFVAEVNILFRTSHPNLVKLYGFCYHQNIKALVYEYVPNESLDTILDQNHQGPIVWRKLHKIAVQTALGLSYLHDGCDVQMVHQDFKASNVLLDSNFFPKIKHFGVAKLINRNKTHVCLRTTEVSCNPVPQKYISSQEATSKCDIYSFGVMLFEILVREKNWMAGEWELDRIWWRYQKGQLDELIHEWAMGDENKARAKVMCMVAFWCIQKTEQIRPPMSTVVKMLNMEVPVPTPSNNPTMPSVATSTFFYE